MSLLFQKSPQIWSRGTDQWWNLAPAERHMERKMVDINGCLQQQTFPLSFKNFWQNTFHRWPFQEPKLEVPIFRRSFQLSICCGNISSPKSPTPWHFNHCGSNSWDPWSWWWSNHGFHSFINLWPDIGQLDFLSSLVSQIFQNDTFQGHSSPGHSRSSSRRLMWGCVSFWEFPYLWGYYSNNDT